MKPINYGKIQTGLWIISIVLTIGILTTFAQEPQSDAKPSPNPLIANDCREKPETCQTVTNQYVADAEKAFALVVEQREALKKFIEERRGAELERQAAETLIKAIDQLLKIKDLSIQTLENIVNIQSRAITTLSNLVEKLEKAEIKKSGFQKFFDGVKKVFDIVTGVLIGRAIGG